MNFTRFAILAFLTFLAPLTCLAKRTHVAMSTQKMHIRHLNKSHSGPYGFGGKLSKSRDHKFHPTKHR